MHHQWLIGMLCGVFFACSGLPAQAAKVIKIGHIMPESHYNGQALNLFKQKFEELTKGAYEVQVFHNGQLGDEKQLLESMALGVGQMSVPNVAVLGNINKNFSLLTFPYLFPTPEVGLAVCDGPWGQALQKELESLGYVGLAFIETGARNVTNNVRPVARLEDFKGLKLRVMQNPVILNVFRTLGANPTAMAWEEVFSALQQNVIDGQENPLGHIPSFKLYEVQKYLSLTRHALTLNSIVINKDLYDSMEPEHRAALHEAMAQVKVYHKKLKDEGDIAAFAEIRDKSQMQVNEVSPEELARIREVALPHVALEAKKVNAALYESLLQAIRDVESKTP
jgi:tripartite ATP-independent transporter DctP family solute receptor